MKMAYASYAKAKDFTCLGTWTLLVGPEHHLKREALARMRAEVIATGGLGAEATWEVLEGSEVSVSDLQGRCQTLGLFGGARGVVILQAERMETEEQEELAARLAPRNEKERKRAFPPLPGEVAVILVTDESEGRRSKTLKARLMRAIDEHGLVIECPALKAPEAVTWAVGRAKEIGKTLEPAAANKLAGQRVGTGLGELAAEIEKLAIYVGEAKVITAEDVEAVSPRLIEDSVFQLVDHVAAQQPAQAVAALRGLVRDQRQDPIYLLALLAGAIREIWQVKLLAERGWRPGAEVDEETRALLPQDERRNALRALSGRRAFLASKRMGHARAFSWSRLARAMQALASCDQALKGIGEKLEDREVAIELLVVQLCTDVAMPVW